MKSKVMGLGDVLKYGYLGDWKPLPNDRYIWMEKEDLTRLLFEIVNDGRIFFYKKEKRVITAGQVEELSIFIPEWPRIIIKTFYLGREKSESKSKYRK